MKRHTIGDLNGKQRKRTKLVGMRDMTAEAKQSDTLHLDDAVGSRINEIRAMSNAMTNSNTQIGKQLFQMIPRYLRRRTRSHQRLGSKSLQRVSELMGYDTLDAVGRRPGPSKAAVAKKKRKQLASRNVRRRKLLETRPAHKPRLLSTHLWHAKRFKMEDSPGADGQLQFRLPETPNEKVRRPAWRAMTKGGCTVQDTSHVQLLIVEWQTTEQSKQLHVCWQLIMDPTAIWPTGGTAVTQTIYAHYPMMPICPVNILLGANDNEIWLYVPFAVLNTVKDIVERFLPAGVTVRHQIDEYARFSLLGPKSLEKLHHALQCKDADWLRLFTENGVALNTQLQRRQVLQLNVEDPAKSFPRMMSSKKSKTYSHDDMDKLYKNKELIEADVQLSNTDEMHKIYVVDQSVAHEYKQRVSGVTVIVPKAIAHYTWMSLIYSGCLAIGQREREMFAFETGTMSDDMVAFPRRQAQFGSVSRAYDKHLVTQLINEYNKRPPAKRVNFKHHGTEWWHHGEMLCGKDGVVPNAWFLSSDMWQFYLQRAFYQSMNDTTGIAGMHAELAHLLHLPRTADMDSMWCRVELQKLPQGVRPERNAPLYIANDVESVIVGRIVFSDDLLHCGKIAGEAVCNVNEIYNAMMAPEIRRTYSQTMRILGPLQLWVQRACDGKLSPVEGHWGNERQIKNAQNALHGCRRRETD